MKGSEFIKNLNSTLQVPVPDETIAKLNDIELPDDLQVKFAEVFISKERAKNDDSIIEHITKEDRKKNFRIFDEKIKTFLPYVSQEHQNVINNEFQTFTKMDILKTALEDAFKNTKNRVSEDVRKVEDEWANKTRALEEKHRADVNALIENNKKQQFEYVVKTKLMSYDFAEPFKPLKEHLSQLAIIDLQNKGYVYELENGSVAIRQEKDGVKRDVFEQGTENKLTLEKLIDQFADTFITKNNGGKKEDANGQPGNGGQTQPNIPIKAETLQDRMRLASVGAK